MNARKQRRILNIVFWTVWLLASSALAVQVAMAADRSPAVSNDRWQAECGSCHLAYPPRFLPAESWRRLMAQLEHHFGTNASLDAASAAEITAFLERFAGSGRGQRAPDTLRVTQTAWFVRKHDEVPSAAWKQPAVRSASNCAACHVAAGDGDFRERNVRIPR